jgi:hypothetical protein
MDNRLKFGLLIGLASAVFTLLLYVVGVDDNKGLGMISFLILFGGLWLGIKEIRDQEKGGFITFNDAWKQGFRIILWSSVVTTVFTLIYMGWINPDLMANQLDASRIEMEEKGLSSEQIDQAMSMTAMFTTPWAAAVFAFLGNLFIGMLIALIPAAILKKIEPEILA